MLRPTKLITVSEAPPPPERASSKTKRSTVVADQKEQLRLSPETLVVDCSYDRGTADKSIKSAKTAMYNFNIGGRKHFPADTYYAIWRSCPDDPNVTQLLIGLRSHMKEEWRKIVEGAGSRTRRTESNTTPDAGASDDGPFGDDEDE